MNLYSDISDIYKAARGRIVLNDEKAKKTWYKCPICNTGYEQAEYFNERWPEMKQDWYIAQCYCDINKILFDIDYLSEAEKEAIIKVERGRAKERELAYEEKQRKEAEQARLDEERRRRAEQLRILCVVASFIMSIFELNWIINYIFGNNRTIEQIFTLIINNVTFNYIGFFEYAPVNIILIPIISNIAACILIMIFPRDNI